MRWLLWLLILGGTACTRASDPAAAPPSDPAAEPASDPRAVPPADGAASQQELVQQFTAAYERRDAPAIEALVYWPRGRDNATDREGARAALAGLFLTETSPPKVQKADVVPVPADRELSYTIKGIRYAPPLAPTGQIVLTLQPTTSGGGYATSTSMTILIGEHGGRHYVNLGFPSEPVAHDAPAGEEAFHATLGTMAPGHRVSITLNGVPVPTITGGSSQMIVLWAPDEPTPDRACLRRGRNDIEIRYDPIDPAHEALILSFYLKSPGYTEDVFLFEPENRKSGTITASFELQREMPPNFKTQRLTTP